MGEWVTYKYKVPFTKSNCTLITLISGASISKMEIKHTRTALRAAHKLRGCEN